MKILWGAIALLACSVLMAQGSVMEFREMIEIATGKLAFPYYTSYGCYCGFGDRGQPQDATDRCCFAHECCYVALDEKCNPESQGYTFTSCDGKITCAHEGSWCQMETCECDRVAALCMRDNLDSYNLSLIVHPMCNEEDMLC